ncbi:hypothetical protein HOK96_02040 [bacterium]|jgi:hypothetical protein|nr:hypothetical protein [bacterium]MBT3903654.1 hypothetical protein [bacterium]MBT5345813.1 hypothetical protein [bacterium]MBT6131434.1 hypothetical protein [bacterium]
MVKKILLLLGLMTVATGSHAGNELSKNRLREMRSTVSASQSKQLAIEDVRKLFWRTALIFGGWNVVHSEGKKRKLFYAVMAFYSGLKVFPGAVSGAQDCINDFYNVFFDR